MNAESRSDADVSRAPHYNFDRLEQSVEFLIKEHERLSGEREALLAELVDREHRIATLETRLDGEKAKRATAAEGVDKILGRLGQLQASAAAAAKAAE